MKVEGQGDASFDASEGAEANGKVDMAAKPETPMEANKAPAVPAGKPVAAGASVTAPIANSGALAPAPAAAAPVPAGTTMIQLGAFGSQVGADQTWASLVRKVPGLSGLQKSVAAAAVGGSTVYRLRANAGTTANGEALCGKVKAAGNVCLVVR
jgi:cell division protein FtsN